MQGSAALNGIARTIFLIGLCVGAPTAIAHADTLWERLYGKPKTPAASDCVLDHCADKTPIAPIRPGAAPRFTPTGDMSGPFDFYVLSLSWSSGFCANEGDQKGRNQCEVGSNLGFVVHGLWPQNERGFPADCAGPRAPSRQALDAVRGLYPDEGLARYEWRKHGTCSGKPASAYFTDVRRARDAVAIPPAFTAPHEERRTGALDIERAFVAANPGLRTDMMAIACPRGVLEEVRVCLSKDLRSFVACPQVSRAGCHAGDIAVPPVR